MARSKAYLFGGVEIRWTLRSVAASRTRTETPAEATFHFPGGLKDYPRRAHRRRDAVVSEIFAGKTEKQGGHGSVEWAVTWFAGDDGFIALLLQHHPDAGRRHPRGRPPHRAAARACKAYAELTRQQARRVRSPPTT